ncbi:MAG: OmpH family outer membrane protein [Spirochaetota bacterium]
MKALRAGNRTQRIVIPALLFVVAGVAYTQQLTTVAVFDMNQVVLSFYQDSAAVREYREAEERFRTDLLLAEETLSEYQSRRADALDRNDGTAARRLREDIQALEEDITAMRERWYAEQAQLEEELAEEEFYNQLYDTVDFVAQDNGYTVVLESTALGTSLFWYSDEVDITEEIIQELLARFR